MYCMEYRLLTVDPAAESSECVLCCLDKLFILSLSSQIFVCVIYTPLSFQQMPFLSQYISYLYSSFGP